MSALQPWKATVPKDIAEALGLAPGTEILVQVGQRFSNRSGDFEISHVEVAFRGSWDRTWGPPTELRRAP